MHLACLCPSLPQIVTVPYLISMASPGSVSLICFLSHSHPLLQSQAKSTILRLTPSRRESGPPNQGDKITAAVRSALGMHRRRSRSRRSCTLTSKAFDYARFYFAYYDAGVGFYYSNTSPNAKLHMKIPIIPCREMDW